MFSAISLRIGTSAGRLWMALREYGRVSLVSPMTCTVVLLIVAALVIRSFAYVLNQARGFDSSQVTVAHVNLFIPQSRQPDAKSPRRLPLWFRLSVLRMPILFRCSGPNKAGKRSLRDENSISSMKNSLTRTYKLSTNK